MRLVSVAMSFVLVAAWFGINTGCQTCTLVGCSGLLIVSIDTSTGGSPSGYHGTITVGSHTTEVNCPDGRCVLGLDHEVLRAAERATVALSSGNGEFAYEGDVPLVNKTERYPNGEECDSDPCKVQAEAKVVLSPVAP